jgi:hypothetical protein
VLIRAKGEATWNKPTTTAYDNEAALQTLIEKSPELLPGSKGAPVLTVREMSVESGFIDLVVVDSDGTITLVECKLRANPQIRREVVGQIMAYASCTWGMSYEQFDGAFNAPVKDGQTLAQRMEKIAPEGWNEEQFRTAVQDNLTTGRFRLVIAVDEITDELKRIVLYLNQHTNSEVQILALELRYIADKGVEILFPTVYGEESTATKKPSAKNYWDEASVLAVLESICTPQVYQAIIELLEFFTQNGGTIEPGSAALPNIYLACPLNGKRCFVASFSDYPKGKARFTVYFDVLAGKISEEKMLRVADHLSTGVPTALERLSDLKEKDFKKQPSFLVNDILTQPGAVEAIKAALMELLQPE